MMTTSIMVPLTFHVPLLHQNMKTILKVYFPTRESLPFMLLLMLMVLPLHRLKEDLFQEWFQELLDDHLQGHHLAERQPTVLGLPTCIGLLPQHIISMTMIMDLSNQPPSI